MGLKTYFQRRILRKADELNERKKEMKNLLKMRSALVLCSVNSQKEAENIKTVFSNLSHKFKKIEVLAFVEKEKMPESSDDIPSQIIYSQQLNWMGNVKNSNALSAFVNEKYDILIDMNFNNRFVLNRVLVESRALLKVGSNQRESMLDYFDLIIKTDGAQTKTKFFIDQIFYFLQNINKNGDS